MPSKTHITKLKRARRRAAAGQRRKRELRRQYRAKLAKVAKALGIPFQQGPSSAV